MKIKLLKVCSIVFWLISFNIYSQNVVSLDSSTKQINISESLYYYEDSENIETKESILEKTFLPKPSSFTGKQSTKIWYQLKLRNTSLEKLKLVCRVHTISFNYLKFYKKENGKLKEIYNYKQLQNKNIEIPFSMNKQKEIVIYAEVFFRKSVYFPIKIAEVSENEAINTRTSIFLGGFYSFALIVFCINILFYINTKNSFFIFYCFLLLSTTLILFELDNGFYLLFGNSNYIRHVDLCLHISLAISVALFTGNSIRIKKYYPKIAFIATLLIFINIVFYSIYVITDQLFWYSTGTAINIVILFMYESIGIMLSKKEPYARFVVIGYSVFLGFSLLYDLPVQYGMVDVGITEWILKIGAFFEMIVFLYAISYRHKRAVIDRVKMNEELQNELKFQQLIALENSQAKVKLEKKKQLKSKEVYIHFVKQYRLTPRESDIGELLLKGYSNKKISENLNLKVTTVKFHITNIFVKIDITKRIEFLNIFLEFKNKNSL